MGWMVGGSNHGGGGGGGGEIFCTPPVWPLGPTYTVDTGSFLGVKWPGRGVDHPPPSSTEFKERA